MAAVYSAGSAASELMVTDTDQLTVIPEKVDSSWWRWPRQYAAVDDWPRLKRRRAYTYTQPS